jgi:rhodanese-related sulfurtransferase
MYQAVLIIIIAAVLALIVNTFSNNRIPLKGSWPSISGSDSVVIPPSAQEGDPPFISLDEAAAKYQSRKVVFIDARDTADYSLGHIKGALNIPYDYYEAFWDRAMADLAKDMTFVIYCSGTECELSLFLGRDMVARGYRNVLIFFGGWREWEKAGLPIENGE